MRPLWIIMVSQWLNMCQLMWLVLFINVCVLTVQTMMTINTLLNGRIRMNSACSLSCRTKGSMMNSFRGDLAELVYGACIISYHCYAGVICEVQEENAAAREIRQEWSKMTQNCTYRCSHTEQTLFLTCCRTCFCWRLSALASVLAWE